MNTTLMSFAMVLAVGSAAGSAHAQEAPQEQPPAVAEAGDSDELQGHLAQPATTGQSTTPVKKPSEKMATTLDPNDAAMNSRVCGLVLLSDGRRLARDAKVPGAPGEVASDSIATLTAAFMLLADGRQAGADVARARAIFNQMVPAAAPVDPSIRAYCNKVLARRRAAPDFQSTEQDRWKAASQAQSTFNAE